MSDNRTPPKPKAKPNSMTLSINTSNAITTGQAAVRAQLKIQQGGTKK